MDLYLIVFYFVMKASFENYWLIAPIKKVANIFVKTDVSWFMVFNATFNII